MMRSGSTALAIALAAWLFGAPTASAQQIVTLTSLDGATTVEGELISFDGESYTLNTALGVISVAAAQVTCAGAACPTTGAPLGFDGFAEFALSGSNIVGDGLVPALIEGFALSIEADAIREVGASANERVFGLTGFDGTAIASISVSAHGTETAFPALAGGSAAFGLASRRMQGAEAGLPDLRDGPGEHILALDGLVAVVHRDNPVHSITMDQLAAVFAGRITDWSQLGGPAQPISVYLPDDSSGTLRLFDQLVLAPRRMAPAPSAERLASHAELSDLVSIDPTGIGLTGYAYARATRMLSIRQQCGIVSTPTSFTIKSEEYPLSRRLYAYGDPASQPAQARAFLDFALSDGAQPLIADAGFVDRDIERQGIAVQGARIANSITSPEEFSLPVFREMLTELKEAERLSVTFRFTPGSTLLETRSQSEAERFARLLDSGAFTGKEILLVGFTDSVGEFAVNRSLAVRRAESVLQTLQSAVAEGALEDVPILVQSYGELIPVGCNDTAEGRELNRRVEVWVRDRQG